MAKSMDNYRVKKHPFPGTRYSQIAPQARKLLRSIAKRTKRRPYLRSAYFRKDKIFFTYFWQHLTQIRRYQRVRRLKYLPCAVELIQKSHLMPEIHLKRNHPHEQYYRFNGIAPNGVEFAVQIKENLRSKRKELMSVFPYQ